jgi:DNA repair exonuclease SbcCD ATPase subunit
VKNRAYYVAYQAAASELESLLSDQERIEERILSLRKSMNALATLISQHEGKDKDFTDYAAARLHELIDNSLTDDIHKIVSASSHPLTASEIRQELKELGGSLAEHSNPLATIHSILNRLAESGRVKETVKAGKKAWDRYRSITERLRMAGESQTTETQAATQIIRVGLENADDLPDVYKSGMRGAEKPRKK